MTDWPLLLWRGTSSPAGFCRGRGGPEDGAHGRAQRGHLRPRSEAGRGTRAWLCPLEADGVRTTVPPKPATAAGRPLPGRCRAPRGPAGTAGSVEAAAQQQVSSALRPPTPVTVPPPLLGTQHRDTQPAGAPGRGHVAAGTCADPDPRGPGRHAGLRATFQPKGAATAPGQ